MSDDIDPSETSDIRDVSKASDNDGLSPLSKALLRISASLDIETVLQETVDSLREVTGALDGCIVTIDETGTPLEFVTTGMTKAQHRAMEEWSAGPELFEHLRDLSGPFRIKNFKQYARKLGVTWEFALSSGCVCTPIRHMGVQVGSFFLGDKGTDTEFTDEDIDALMLFAFHAGAAIVNARAFRAEQRTRADLEALIETSPVGVVVLDPKSGKPVSINREARNLFDVLLTSGESIEQLYEIASCRFGDGSETALNSSRLRERLSSSESIRAEEVEISTPDGRSVTVIVNSTPIQGDDLSVISRVVTLQDLEPILALERMQADFLSMVSHELRTPLSAVKGSTITVLESGQTFAPTETQQFFRIINEQADSMSALIADLLDAGRIDTGTLSISAVPTEVGAVLEQARTAFLSSEYGHDILIDLPNGLPQMMADQTRIVQVLSNLLINAARATPDSSPITISAECDESQYWDLNN